MAKILELAPELRTLFVIALITACTALLSARGGAVHGTYVMVRAQEGFVPHELTIPQGSTVVFKNETDGYYWPASDIHPWHTILSEFDPRRPLLPNEEWKFTFNKVGSWGLHDHLDARFIGVINVVPDPNLTKTTCDDILNSDCWSVLLYETLESQGVDSAFNLFKLIYTLNPSFARRCHGFTHDIGLKTFVLYGTDFDITPKISYCDSGFIHGYMEGFLTGEYSSQDAFKFCDNLFETIGEEFKDIRGQCIHAIGHGSLERVIHTEPGLWSQPTAMVKEALSVCEYTNMTYVEKMRCSSGVFNVYRDWIGSYDHMYDLNLEPKTFLDICPAMDTEYAKDGCYWEMGKLLGLIIDARGKLSDGLSTFSLREEMNPRDYALYAGRMFRSSAHAIGRSGVHEYSDEQILEYCRTVETQLQLDCIEGLVEGLIWAGEPGKEEDRVIEFCEFEMLSEEERHACYAMLQSNADLFYSDQRVEEICAFIPREDIDAKICS